MEKYQKSGPLGSRLYKYVNYDEFGALQKNTLKTQWPILPQNLFGWENDEIDNFNFINKSRYYSYEYAESL